MAKKKLLTTAEAAKLLGIQPVSVRRAISLGTLPATRFGQAWQVSPEAVQAYAAKYAGKPGPKN